MSSKYSNIWMKRDSFYLLIAGVIIVFALALRLMGLGRGLWLDEWFTIKIITSPKYIQEFISCNQPPLYHILLKLWSQFCFREEFLRSLSVLFGIGTLVIMMRWIKQYSYLGSFFVGILFATLPIMLRYSQELRDYSLLLPVVALSFFYASRIIADPSKLSGYIGLAISLTFTASTHVVGIMIIPSVCLYLIVSPLARRKVNIKRMFFVICAPIFIFTMIAFMQKFVQQASQLDTKWWYPAISLGYITVTAKSLFGLGPLLSSFNSHPTVLRVVGVFFSFMAIYMFFAGDWKRTFPLLTAAILYWVLLILVSIFAVRIFIDRTALPGMIPFIGFAGWHITTIRKRFLKMLAAGLLVLLCATNTLDWARKANWSEPSRGISQVLQSLKSADDIVLFYPFYIEGIIRYYAVLPKEASYSVSLEAGIEEIEKEINNKISLLKAKANSYHVFLITRDPPEGGNYPQNYIQLLKYLELRFGQSIFSKRMGDFSISEYEARKYDQSR